MTQEIIHKVRTYNIVPPIARGTRGHKYGFAADIRLRHYKREMRIIKADMKSRTYRGWNAADKRLNKREWSFTTTMKGIAYLVLTTPGLGGFIIVQQAISGEVVCCMMKRTKAHVTNTYWARSLTANK